MPEWPREAIAPGESGVIRVRYATNRIGKFAKTVTLMTNEPESQHVLHIKGEVLSPVPSEATPAAPANKTNG